MTLPSRQADPPVTIICGKCEREWSGDITASRTCPDCGNDGEIEPHVVREEGAR